jgi:hypothetical protein
MKELVLVALVLGGLVLAAVTTFKVENHCTTTTQQVDAGAVFERRPELSRTSCGWRISRR